jgi:hypothetical protein
MNPLQAINTLAATLITWTLAAGIALAQGPPTGYYSTIDTSSSSALRSSLHSTIDDHQRYPYTSSGTDTWDILEAAQEHPNNSNLILDIYRNEDYSKQGGGNSFYNREHSWPNSYGFPDDGGGNYPYTDCHVLFLCDIGYNNSRGNKPFRYCSSSCTEETTASNNGQGGGSGSYPGQSNWVSSQGSLGHGRLGPSDAATSHARSSTWMCATRAATTAALGTGSQT